MPRRSLYIILDTNIWISYAIGQKLQSIDAVLNRPGIRSIICDELIGEFTAVASRSKFRKYISPERLHDTIRLMLLTGKKVRLRTRVKAGKDPKDFFLLSLALQVKADVLVTGDQDLLSLHPFRRTQILNYRHFIAQFIKPEGE